MKARAHRGRLHHARHHSKLNVCIVLAVVWVLALIWMLYSAADSQDPEQQSNPTQQLKYLPSLEDLYGPIEGLWPSKSGSGPSQLLVLSYYHAKSSLVARLLMLMGVYAGEATQLRIDVADKLRWWELHQLTTLNDLMLQAHSSPGLPPHLAHGFHVGALTRDESYYYQDRLQGIASYLGRHRPWLVKDPRLSWLAPLWLEQLESPLCVVVVDMQPQRLAQHLAQQQQETQMHSSQQQLVSGSDQVVVSAATHLERWTNATLSSLKACFGVPTLVLPNSVLQPPLLQPFMDVLQQHLMAAGVQGTRLPAPDLIQEQYLAHLHIPTQPQSFCAHAADSTAANSSSIDGAALLAEPCHWLPPQPQTGSAGGSGPSGPDATTMLPLPTQALLSALQDHLTAHLAQPGPALQYSRAAGEVYTAYASRVKQLVAQRGAGLHHAEHHQGIGALIVEALKHVEVTVTAAARARHRARELLT